MSQRVGAPQRHVAVPTSECLLRSVRPSCSTIGLRSLTRSAVAAIEAGFASRASRLTCPCLVSDLGACESDAMPSRDHKLSLSAEIEMTEQRLRIYEAIAVACRDPHAILDVVVNAESVESAQRELQRAFGFDDVQSGAILDMQYRRATSSERNKILDEAKDLTEQVAYLRSLEP